MTITSSSFGGGGTAVKKWVSGTTYAVDDLVWSPVSYLTYIRTVAGAGATDPSSDSSNWAVFGSSRIRQVVRGTITINSGSNLNTATLGTPVLNTAKCELRYLGTNCVGETDATADDALVRVALTNTTTITASRLTNSVTLAATVGYELTEWW